jgi:hypothetical protein
VVKWKGRKKIWSDAPRSVRVSRKGDRYFVVSVSIWDRDSSIGIATRYGLHGPGIQSRWEARFSAPVQTGHVAHPASYTMGTRSFPGVKRLGRGVDHPTRSSAEVKEREELYLYSTSGPSWAVLGWPLPLPLPPASEIRTPTKRL